MSPRVREPAAADRYYPGEKHQLLRFLDKILIPAKDRESYRSVNAVIVPHAGYEFSGKIAGRAFSHVGPGAIDRVIIIGPSHYVGFHGIAIAPYDLFRTPLGDIFVDVSACDDLFSSNDLFTHSEEAHRYEHSLEVELPFIQKIAPKSKIIPLVTGDLSLSETCEVADRLLSWWGVNTLIVISSDFTHYGEQFGYCPFSKQAASESLEKLDHGAIRRILQKDTSGFAKYVQKTGATICGRIPITILLALMEKSAKQAEPHLIEYTNSGKILNDYTTSVSYASILTDGNPGTINAVPLLRLTKNDGQLLLKLAYDAISAKLNNESLKLPDNIPTYLYAKGNAFVTIRIGKKLRGCIGTITAEDSLIENIIKNAESAAFEDPRFPPLNPEELSETDVEISCLTVPSPINSIAEIIPGKHGIILDNGPHRAVFLPQVAIEQDWDKETMLENLSLKAGLPRTGWCQQGTTFSIFEVTHISKGNINLRRG